MKRDMELVRKIAIALDDAPTSLATQNPAIDGYTAEEIAYHAYLMLDGGLVRGEDITNNSSDDQEAVAFGLTWAGHDFVEKARNEVIWRKVMGIVRDKGGAATLEIVKQLLIKAAKDHFGLP